MPPLREAGRHARLETRRRAIRALVALGVLIAITAASGLALGLTNPVFIAIEIVAIAAMWSYNRFVLPILDRWDRGARGEEEVGKILERLRDHGWHVLHDVAFGRGNIDHILIGAGGLLSVETKSHRGRIDVRRLDERMLKQAYAQSKLLSNITGRSASPLLVFSSAYLFPRPVSRQRGVVVLPARMIAGHLARRTPVMSPEEARELYERLRVAAEG